MDLDNYEMFDNSSALPGQRLRSQAPRRITGPPDPLQASSSNPSLGYQNAYSENPQAQSQFNALASSSRHHLSPYNQPLETTDNLRSLQGSGIDGWGRNVLVGSYNVGSILSS